MSGRKRPRGTLLIGHPRSGTTLLRRLLNAHTKIAAPPETHLFSACARFIEADVTTQSVDMGVLAGLHFAGFDDESVIGSLRELAFGFLDKYANRRDKQIWVEKTAFDIFYLNEIERLCGDRVFYLGIIRHPLDVAVSCKSFCDATGLFPRPLHKYIRQYPQPIEAFVRSWIDSTNALIELGERHASDSIMCRYEDLVDDPETILDEVLKAMGLAMEPDLPAKALTGTDEVGFSDHKSLQVDQIHSESIGRWSSIPKPQVSRLAPLINPLLERCGYDLIEEGPPISITDARKRYAVSLAVHSARRKDGSKRNLGK